MTAPADEFAGIYAVARDCSPNPNYIQGSIHILVDGKPTVRAFVDSD
ncbi:MAG: hypothetical protein LUO93_07240 [Methanomicrobiales archaeon]|nr:hypothetical protein [Methanomicrobiales archaeon]